MSQGYEVSAVTYNSVYKVIGTHPDGRIFAIRYDGTAGLYVVDEDLNLVSTLNITLPNHQYFTNGNSINECVILRSGTMLAWGICRTGSNITTFYRSDDISYSSFSVVLELPDDICVIERGVGISTLDDTIMFGEYTLGAYDYDNSLWTAPLSLNVWRGNNDGQDWNIIHTMNRNAQYAGDENRIRHFHTVRYDPYENLFWLGSGDWGVECRIYTLKPDGSDITLIGAGEAGTDGQRWRTTNIMFTKDYVYWGSDSCLYDHEFQRYVRATGLVEQGIEADDCIRTGGKFSLPQGDLMIAHKNYEKSDSNTGLTTDLYFCDDFQGGEWYQAYTWDTNITTSVTYIPQIVGNGANRFYANIQNVKDELGNAQANVTAIIDIEEASYMGITKLSRETYEDIIYAPGAAASADLEAATKTITAAAEASGTANKDYLSALTLTIPTDSRLAINRICSRIAVTIDSMTATHLYCKVYVDVQDADHLLFSEDFTTTGAKLDAVDVTASSKAIIFNLLKDGAAHTLYFFFYVDAGNAVLSLVQGSYGVGTCATSDYVLCMTLTHIGSLSIAGWVYQTGTGTGAGLIANATNNSYGKQLLSSSTRVLAYSPSTLAIMIKGTVATDLNYWYGGNIVLRTFL